MPIEYAGQLATGTTLLDDYVVESKLGEGGMGIVYLVRNTTTGVSYAVKRSKLTDARARGTLLAELQTWIDLPPHPHIVTCRFFRTHGDDITIFSDYCQGGSLSAWIAGGKLRHLTQVLDIAIQFAWGLHAAHLCGLVHQDLKPGNVLMTLDGIAKVSDFGLSRATYSTDSGTPLVASAGMMTRAYASPEQMSGARLSRHTDVWSWGVSLLEMLIGEVLWHSGVAVADSLDSLTDEGNENPELAERLNPEIVAILRRCFEPVPHERWNSLAEAGDALICIYEHETGNSYPRAIPVALPRSEKRPRDNTWDVEHLVRNIMASVGRKADISELETATSSAATTVAKIRLMEIALKWLQQSEDDDPKAWQGLKTQCLRAKASFHFDANDIHGCDQCLTDAISCLSAATSLLTDEDVLRQLADTHLEKSLYLFDANVSERAVEPAQDAINIAREQIRQDGTPEMEWVAILARAITAEANALSRNNDEHKAIARYDEAIAIRESLPVSASNTNNLAINLQNKGNLLCRLGRAREGIEVLERALQIRETLCAEKGGDRFQEDLGYSLYNIAKSLLEAGEKERALCIAKRLVAIRSDIATKNPTEGAQGRLANALSLNAHLVDAAGDTQGALENAVDAVCTALSLVVERGRNDINAQLQAHLNVFGMIFDKLGFGKRDNDPALVDSVGKLFMHPAIDVFDGDQEFGGCLSDYAMALVRLKRYHEAESNLHRVLANDKRRYGTASREVGMTLHNLGISSYHADQCRQAEDYLRQAVEVFESIQCEAGYLGGSLCVLAQVFEKASRYDEALPLYQRVDGLLEDQEGFEGDYVRALLGKARVLKSVGRTDDAVQTLKRAFTVSALANGEDHVETGAVADRLGMLLAQLGRYLEAVDWLRISLRCASKDFENVCEIQEDFARLLFKAAEQAISVGKISDAEHLFTESAGLSRICDNNAGEAAALTNLGLMQRKAGKREQAVKTLERALALNQSVLGPGHPNTLMCMSLYGVALVFAGRSSEALKCFEKGLARTPHLKRGVLRGEDGGMGVYEDIPDSACRTKR